MFKPKKKKKERFCFEVIRKHEENHLSTLVYRCRLDITIIKNTRKIQIIYVHKKILRSQARGSREGAEEMKYVQVF